MDLATDPTTCYLRGGTYNETVLVDSKTGLTLTSYPNENVSLFETDNPRVLARFMVVLRNMLLSNGLTGYHRRDLGCGRWLGKHWIRRVQNQTPTTPNHAAVCGRGANDLGALAQCQKFQ